MVDTPKETNGDEAMGDNPSGKKAKHGRHRRRSKPRHNNTGTGEENLDGAEEEYDPDQPTFEQAAQEHGQASPDEQVTDGYLEDDNYMPPFKDEVSLGDDGFGVPEDPIEQERFKHRLIATARSLERSSNSSKRTKICSQTDGLKSWRPKNTDSNPRAGDTQSINR